MTQIQTFQHPLSNLKIQGICINGDPWSRGKTWLRFLDTLGQEKQYKTMSPTNTGTR